jgi:glucose-1-phosphate adenylyltransferase
MASPDPPFDFYQPDRPIFTHPRFLPGTEVHGGHLQNVLLTDGCRIYDAEISQCVIGLRSLIATGVTVKDSIIMGADYYEMPQDLVENRRLGRPDIGIGRGSHIEGAIIDKKARVGQDVVIRCIENRPDAETENWVARDGIVLVPKNAVIPNGTII